MAVRRRRTLLTNPTEDQEDLAVAGLNSALPREPCIDAVRNGDYLLVANACGIISAGNGILPLRDGFPGLVLML